MTKDYYKILGVKENATQDEIKKAYRQLSKQYHPDVNPEGAETFKSIAEAYDVIGDEKKRQEYNFKRQNPFGGFGNVDGDLGDIMDLFNRGYNPFSNRRRQRAPDKVIILNLTPQESLLGVSKTLNYQRKSMCTTCNGQGGDRTHCNTCAGRGVIQQQFNLGGTVHIQNSTCPSCQGGGAILVNRCFTCSGHGTTPNLHTITVDIPKSVDDGDFLRVPNSGDFTPNLGIGDLVVQVKMINDGTYQKIGANLHFNLKIAPEDIFVKKDITLDHPEGQVIVKFPPKLNTATPIRLKNKGYYTNEGRGDFIVKFDVDTNLTKLSEDILEKIENILK
jgi:molecular chaperone DnaJ